MYTYMVEKPQARQRTRCEVYSRVVGYIRPVQQWHVGKQGEFKLRVTYDKQLSEDSCATCSCCSNS